MDIDKFKRYSPVRNIINKALGVVIKVAGDNVTVHTKTGDRMTFKSQYLEPAGESEAETLKLLTAQLKNEEETAKAAVVKISDPGQIHQAHSPQVPEVGRSVPDLLDGDTGRCRRPARQDLGNEAEYLGQSLPGAEGLQPGHAEVGIWS